MQKMLFKCDLCEATLERWLEAYESIEGKNVVWVFKELPANWAVVRGLLICGKHEVLVNGTGVWIDDRLVRLQ